MDFATNPLSLVTLLLACAVLTTASCVAFIGTGYHYQRIVEQFQDISGVFDLGIDDDPAALQRKLRQVRASEGQAALVIRALNCFYAAITGFGLSSLITLLSAVLVFSRLEHAVLFCFATALIIDAFGALAMIGGATMLFREARFAFRAFQEKSGFFTQQARQIVLRNSELSPDR
jgi:hypothetical protein